MQTVPMEHSTVVPTSYLADPRACLDHGKRKMSDKGEKRSYYSNYTV